MNKVKRLVQQLFFATAILSMFSCKTEVITAATPYAEIISFKVPYDNGKDSISGIINGDKIIINWPGLSEWPIPQKLKPKITVSKNAQVVPGSNQEIELKDGLSYEVKAQDGTLKKYKIELNNMALFPYFPDKKIDREYRIGNMVRVATINLATDGSDKATLINEEKKEYFPLPSLLKNKGYVEFILDQADGNGIPPGEYYVKVTNKFNRYAISETKLIKINNLPPTPYPILDLKEPLKLKAGDTFIVPLKYGNKDINFSSAYIAYFNSDIKRTSLRLEVIGTEENGTKLKLAIPKNFNNEITSTLDQTIRINSTNGVGINPIMKFPIQIIK